MTPAQQGVWDVCTQVGVNFDEVMDMLLNQPQLLGNIDFKNKLIARVAELEGESPFSELQSQYANLQVLLKGKIPLRRNAESKETIYAYLPHNSSAAHEERLNQEKVSERFFRTKNPLKNGFSADILHTEITQAIHNKQPIALDGRSARAVILALTKIISTRHDGSFPVQLAFTIGDTRIICKAAELSGRKRQKANLWMSVEDLPKERYSYGSFSGAVDNKLTSIAPLPARQEQLAKLMTAKTGFINSFQENDFNQYAKIKLLGEDTCESIRNPRDKQVRRKEIIEHIHYLNGLNFLRTITEVIRRLYRNNGEIHHYQDVLGRRSDAIPVAIFQARAANLLLNSHVTQRDVFGESVSYGKSVWGTHYGNAVIVSGSGLHRAKYGVVTGSGTIENMAIVEGKIANVNSKVAELVIRPLIGGLGFFMPALAFSNLDLANPSLQYKAGKNYMRQEVGNEFGGDQPVDCYFKT